MNNSCEEMISVIIPVYNVEHYLQRCLDSIRKQSYDNLEILLINDGSTDGSAQICEKNAAEDDRIRVITQENKGISAVRNKGIEAASGNYIVFVDSDDYIAENMVECLYRALREENADICCCSFDKGEEEKIPAFDKTERRRIVFDTKEAMAQFYNSLYIYMTLPWNKIYKKCIFSNIQYPEGKLHEDEFTSWKLVMHSQKVVFIDQCLYFYFLRKDGITGKGLTWKSFVKTEAYQERLDYFENYGDEKLLDEAVYRYLRVYEKLCDFVVVEGEDEIWRLKEHIQIIFREYKRLRKKMTLEHRIKSLVVWCKIYCKRVVFRR